MNNRLALIAAKVACFSIICALAALGTGCESSSGVWPREATRIQSVDGIGLATGVGELRYVFAGNTVWQLNPEGFSPQSLLSDDYQLALGTPVSGAQPYLGGSASLPEGTAFVRRGQDKSSDGQGAAVYEDYEELVLVSAADPTMRAPVLRVRGTIDAVRLGQSVDGTTQVGIIDVSPRDTNDRHLLVMTRSRSSDWANAWSSADENESRIRVHAYGMVTSENSDPAVIVIGDRSSEPQLQNPIVVMIDSRGFEREVPAQFDSDVKTIQYLSDFRWQESSTPVFRYETRQNTRGLLFYDHETARMRMHESAGSPLALLGDSNGGMLAITEPNTGGTGVELVGLEGSESIHVQTDFAVRWAKPLTGSQPGVQRIALIGGRDQNEWCISILDYSTSTGGHALTQAVDSWKVADKRWGISSLDEMTDVERGGQRQLVIGMSAGDEGAFATIEVGAPAVD